MTTLSDAAAPPATATRYDRLQRSLHWLMALIIFTAIGIGLYCSWLVPGTPERQALLEIHKSLGLTALTLVVVRVLWRLAVGAPAYVKPLGRLTHLAAGAGHLALYALMLLMPLSGYVFSAAGGRSLPWFGLFQWPNLLPKDPALAELGRFVHGWGATAIYVVLSLHLAAVLWHRFVLKDEVLARMLPPR